MRPWMRHFFYTRACLKTTWKLRVGVFIVVILTATATRDFWTASIGRSLVCARDVAPSDLILLENFDPNYILFEHAAELEKAGLAPRTLVPVRASRDPAVASPIFSGFAEIMARYARLNTWDVVPIQEIEPIRLNAALQIRERLDRDHVRSVILVAGGFQSRRTFLVYRSVLNDAGIQLRCDPVFGQTKPEHWTATWHGMQEVAEEFVKLQYYRLYVLPFTARGSSSGGV
jgi:hypothetical protein